MKNTITLFFIIFYTSSFSQKYLDAKIITQNNDTIYSRIKIRTNLFDKKLIDENSFYRTMIMLDDNGKKTAKINASEVKELTFIDFYGKSKIYVNNGKALMELIFSGKKIKWYYEISSNLYDGSASLSDYLVDENGKEYRLQFLKGYKRILLEVTKSKPELIAEIENTALTVDNVILILKKYETE